jgi:hypothetical protein
MTQDSAFHNGFQIGDAKYYTAEAFHKYLMRIYLAEGGYVVPSGSSDTLGVSFVAGQTVAVAAGSAFVAGVYYNNSASLNVVLEDNPAGTNRIDRIIIRVDWAAQTVRIVAKRGTASSTPVAPSLTQNIGDIYEVSLAAVVVTPSFAGFGDEYIYDERQYILLPEENAGIKNIMFNSEFMSGPSTSLTSLIPFPMWRGNHGGSVVGYSKAVASKFDLQSRGRSLQINSANSLSTYIRVNNGTSIRATLAFIIQVKAGVVDFSIDGGVTTLYKIPVTQNPVVIIARTIVGASGGNQAIEPHFSNAPFKLGQMTLALGNNAAPFEPNEELVLQPTPYLLFTETNVGTGTDSFVLDQDVIWQGVKNGMVRQSFSNALSSTADTGFSSLLNNYTSTTGADILRREIGRVGNSVTKHQQGLLPLELQYDNFWQLAVEFDPIGANTWQLHLTGVQT